MKTEKEIEKNGPGKNKKKRGKVPTAAVAPLLLACVVSHLVVPTRLLLSIETQKKQNKTKMYKPSIKKSKTI